MKTIRMVVAAALAAWAAEAAAEPPVAGERIVKSRCAECHATGKHGAPRIDDRAAWNPRLQGGLDALVLRAIRGHGSMPARGGMAELTDAEFRSAVVYLFNSQYAARTPPPAASPGPNQKTVDGTEIYLGVKPLGDGRYHVNITLRDAKSRAAIPDAQVEVGVTNPVMGGETRKLERFGTGNAVSYGHEFRISGREPHVITVSVRRPGRARPIEAHFDFRG